MKTLIHTLLVIFLGAINIYAQVGIGTTAPDASSILEVDVSSLPANGKKGFLPPRMNTADRDAINGSVPTEGLIIYNTSTDCLEMYNGTDWINLCTGIPSLLPLGTIGACATSVATQLTSDPIRPHLTTSLAAYNAADGSALIPITEAEYQAIEASTGTEYANMTSSELGLTSLTTSEGLTYLANGNDISVNKTWLAFGVYNLNAFANDVTFYIHNPTIPNGETLWSAPTVTTPATSGTYYYVAKFGSAPTFNVPTNIGIHTTERTRGSSTLGSLSYFWVSGNLGVCGSAANTASTSVGAVGLAK